jgi:hypothetical protein
VIPLFYKDADTQGINDTCKATLSMLCEAKIHAKLDSMLGFLLLVSIEK